MKRFTIYENAAPIGEGVQFSDGTVAAVMARGQQEFYGTLAEMLDRCPTWGIAWVDG
jgi:hypothetical protein